MKNLFFSLMALFTILLAQSCATVSPNMHLVYTNDCWNHVNVVKAGSIKPTLTKTCDKMIALPAYQMPGGVSVKTRFKNDVKGTITIDYLYEINNPLLFVEEAKFLLQSNIQEDDYNKENQALELAENTITDKIVKDIVRGMTENMDAANFNETQFESELDDAVNKISKGRGTTMSAFSLKVDFGEQTEEAIDAVSAYGLYKANGMEEVGKEIMKANAGKSQLIINEPKHPTQKED